MPNIRGIFSGTGMLFFHSQNPNLFCCELAFYVALTCYVIFLLSTPQPLLLSACVSSTHIPFRTHISMAHQPYGGRDSKAWPFKHFALVEATSPSLFFLLSIKNLLPSIKDTWKFNLFSDNYLFSSLWHNSRVHPNSQIWDFFCQYCSPKSNLDNVSSLSYGSCSAITNSNSGFAANIWEPHNFFTVALYFIFSFEKMKWGMRKNNVKEKEREPKNVNFAWVVLSWCWNSKLFFLADDFVYWHITYLLSFLIYLNKN